MHTRTGLLVVASVLTACSPRTTTVGMVVDAGPPNTLTVTGQVCTATPDPSGFPVKVVLLVDQSGSTCVTDPPGSQESPGFCEQWAGSATGYPIQTQPARVKALLALTQALQSQPNVEVALVPFETNVQGVWPPLSGQRFARPDSSLAVRINTLQTQLGKASDLQGALAYAYALIASDVNEFKVTVPEVLPRVRYVVVLLTDGPPNPRCANNDALTTYADDLHPHGVWADTMGYCNTADPMDPDGITGFIAGMDRNQDVQLAAYVDALRELERTDHVGAARTNVIFWTNDQALQGCGIICQDLFGLKQRWPGPVPAPSNSAYAYVEGRTLLQDLATRGGGSFAEFTDAAGLATMNFNGVNMDSFAARNVKKTFLPQLAMATAAQGAWALDQDGDGLPDADEIAANTNPRDADSDGDGFNDLFESRHRADGFDPFFKDGRGCDPMSPQTPNCVPRDTDGDGLSQYEEAYLHTSGTLVDSDTDGIPDGLEVRWGFDPLVRNDPNADSDGDGVTDFAEFLANTDPKFADANLAGIAVNFTERPQNDGTVCYDFTATGLPMLDTPFASGPVPPGVNLFKFWFAEAPEAVPEDYGVWKAACTFARLDVTQNPPIVVPPNLQTTLFASDFVSPWTASATTSCSGGAALTP